MLDLSTTRKVLNFSQLQVMTNRYRSLSGAIRVENLPHRHSASSYSSSIKTGPLRTLMSYCLKLLKVNSHGPAATLQGCLSKKRCPCWNFHRHRESKDSCPHGYEDAVFCSALVTQWPWLSYVGALAMAERCVFHLSHCCLGCAMSAQALFF